MKRLFVIDIDETFLKSDFSINAELMTSLENAVNKSHKVIAMTRKSFRQVKHLFEGYEFINYIICNNGAYFYNIKSDKVISQSYVNDKFALDLLEDVKKTTSMFVVYFSKGETLFVDYSEPQSFVYEGARLRELVDETFSTEIQALELLEEKEITQVSIRSTNTIVNQLYDKYTKFDNSISSSINSQFYLDITGHNIDKLSAVKLFSQKLQIPSADVVVFASSDGDASLLEFAGYSFAMSNGSQMARNSAKQVIGDNDSNEMVEKIIKLTSDEF